MIEKPESKLNSERIEVNQRLDQPETEYRRKFQLETLRLPAIKKPEEKPEEKPVQQGVNLDKIVMKWKSIFYRKEV